MSDTTAFGQPTTPVIPPPPPIIRNPADESPTLTANDQLAELEALLVTANVPPLMPLPWRARHRLALVGLFSRLEGLIGPDGEVDVENLDVFDDFQDLIGRADELFEAVALNRSAYVEWSRNLPNQEEVFAALLGKYARAVGESTQSAPTSTTSASN
jgi:hypothetical protein